MRRYADRRRLTTLSEINVTPLLDLAFVLLIIFMITTPLIENSMELIVPTSATSDAPATQEDLEFIEVNREGTILFNDQEVTLAEIEAMLAGLKAENPDVAVVIRPDKTLEIQQFINVMDAVRRAEITKVGVLTQPESDQENP